MTNIVTGVWHVFFQTRCINYKVTASHFM